MSSDSDLDDFDIDAAAENALTTLLPVKSKEKYEKSYEKFKAWCSAKKVEVIDEKVMLAYFSTEMEKFKASTVWTFYSMLRTTLNIHDNIDIAEFNNLRALLKRKNDGYQAKKSKIFKTAEVYRFIKEAPDDPFLAVKAVLIVGIYGACRRDELVRMSLDDVEYVEGGIKIIIPRTKTNIVREFIITEGGDKAENLVNIVKNYIKLRPLNIPKNRFFMQYRQGKITKQPIGVNAMGACPEKIATYLELACPKEYTGHCLRRSSASFLADAGADISILKRHAGWTSDKVANGYVERSDNNKRKIADQILGVKIDEPCSSKNARCGEGPSVRVFTQTCNEQAVTTNDEGSSITSKQISKMVTMDVCDGEKPSGSFERGNTFSKLRGCTFNFYQK